MLALKHPFSYTTVNATLMTINSNSTLCSIVKYQQLIRDRPNNSKLVVSIQGKMTLMVKINLMINTVNFNLCLVCPYCPYLFPNKRTCTRTNMYNRKAFSKDLTNSN